MRQVWGVLRALTWAIIITIALLISGTPGVPWQNTASVTQTQVHEAYGKLPLAFEANQGQIDSQVQFLARSQGMSLFLTTAEAVLVLQPRPLPGRTQGMEEGARRGERAPDRSAPHTVPPPTAPTVFRLHFVGANPAPQVIGLEQLPGTSNYFLGNDPTQWRTHIPTYAKVHYREMYPGIDVLYYGNPHQLEYDILVAPGADPSAITVALAWEGMAGTLLPLPLHMDADGALVLPTADGALRLHSPTVYQERAGVRYAIPCQYVLVSEPEGAAEGERPAGGTAQVRFQVAAYDRSQPLIIDPVLSYSTYLGGSAGDEGAGIVVDGAGQAYVTGFTNSANFPTTPGAFQPTFGGGNGDAFVTELNASGSALIYSTYLGGSALDRGIGIAVNGTGQAYVTGFTDSANFPTTPGAFQPTLGGNFDAFVTQFASGSVNPIPALSPFGQALVVFVVMLSGLLFLRRRLSSAG